MATNYQRGRDFEYRTRDKLLEMGAVYVMRAAQSKGKIDLLALWPADELFPHEPGNFDPPWIVQCKRDGRLPRAECSALVSIALEAGAIPMLAKAGKNGRGVEFINLLKEGE